MRAHVRATAENRPGIYRMIAGDGEVVYVGKSKQVRARLLSYFRSAFPDEKGARILREAEAIDWTYVPSEFAAVLEEMRQIKRLRPRLNVALKRDDRHYCFIRLSRGPAPKLLVVRGAGGDERGIYYGPFMGARRVREALRELNDALGLRDCSMDQQMSFADQSELFGVPARTPGCIRYEIGKCLGPCIAAATEGEYSERVRLARAFLDRGDEEPIDRLRDAMAAASDRLEYERAAALRDKARRLEDLREQFARLRFAIESLSFVYAVKGIAGDDRVYLIRRGRVREELAKPRTTDQRAALRARVQDVFAGPERRSAAVPTHEIDELLLLTSWFRVRPRELRRTRSAQSYLEPATARGARRGVTR
jgi:excinuclease ABC subunit C